MELLAGGSEIVAATDADDAGRQLADAIRKSFDAAARPDLVFRRQEPVGAKDWNDQLRACKAPEVARTKVGTVQPK
jgi:hypothetical protein